MASDEFPDQFSHSAERALEAREFASQPEDAVDFCPSEKVVERSSLHRQNVILDHLEDGKILIDDPVQDRMQHIVDTFAKKRRRSLELLAKIAERSAVAVPYAHEMVVTGEDRHLAVADLVSIQLGGLSDNIELFIIRFELGRAERVHRVVDCQRMEVIRRLDRFKLVGGGLAKRDPAKAGAILIELDLLVDRDFADPQALVVIISSDDAHAGLAGMRRPRCTAGRASPRRSHVWTFEYSPRPRMSPAA